MQAVERALRSGQGIVDLHEATGARSRIAFPANGRASATMPPDPVCARQRVGIGFRRGVLSGLDSVSPRSLHPLRNTWTAVLRGSL
jgi:hypothetical protein